MPLSQTILRPFPHLATRPGAAALWGAARLGAHLGTWAYSHGRRRSATDHRAGGAAAAWAVAGGGAARGGVADPARCGGIWRLRAGRWHMHTHAHTAACPAFPPAQSRRRSEPRAHARWSTREDRSASHSHGWRGVAPLRHCSSRPFPIRCLAGLLRRVQRAERSSACSVCR